MRTKSTHRSGLFTPRTVVAVVLCSASVLLAALGIAANQQSPAQVSKPDPQQASPAAQQALRAL
jgi:hypothetical protein